MDKYCDKNTNEVVEVYVVTGTRETPEWLGKAIDRGEAGFKDGKLLVRTKRFGFVTSFTGDWVVYYPRTARWLVLSKGNFDRGFVLCEIGEKKDTYVPNQLRNFLNSFSVDQRCGYFNSRIGMEVVDNIQNGADEIDRLAKALAISEENLKRAEDAIERARKYRRIVEGIDYVTT